jgi:hypothetical protein
MTVSVTATRPKLSLHPRNSRWASTSSIHVSVSFFGCVYQLSLNGLTIARRASTSSSTTSYERPRCRYTAPSCTVENARAASTVPSTSPLDTSTTANESGDADRSDTRAAG